MHRPHTRSRTGWIRRAALITLAIHLATPAWAEALLSPSASAASPQDFEPALAQTYRQGVAVADYWVSEKYDGVRALWNGERLISRQGLPIEAPHWFTLHWPTEALDGELWAGRGQFLHAQSTTAQSQPDEAAWRRMRYMVFDMPHAKGPFSARQTAMQRAVKATTSHWISVAPQWRVDTHLALMLQLNSLSRAGAEGLMLRREADGYRGGRSDDLLKLKLIDDADGVVVAHLPGKGKYTGMTGALQVRTPDGLLIQLGSGLTDALRRDPPAIGSTVTYRFNGHHPSGMPRFARFWRVREAVEGSAPKE